MHFSGAWGMARRIGVYREEFMMLNHITTLGYVLTAISALIFFFSIIASMFKKPEAEGDAWGINDVQQGFEWATTSPPPPYNFETVPPIAVDDPHAPQVLAEEASAKANSDCILYRKKARS